MSRLRLVFICFAVALVVPVSTWAATLKSGPAPGSETAPTGAALASSEQHLEPVRDAQSGRVFAYRVVGKQDKAAGTKATATPRYPAPWRPGQASAQVSASQIAWDFISSHKAALGLSDPEASLRATGATGNQYGHTQRYVQVVGDVPVYGTLFAVSMDPAGVVTYVKSKLADGLPSRAEPALALTSAWELARRHAQAEAVGLKLKIVSSELTFLPLGLLNNTEASDTRLTWRVTLVDEATDGDLFGKTYFLDAASGESSFEYSNHIEAVHRQVLASQSEYSSTNTLNGWALDPVTCNPNNFPENCGTGAPDIESTTYPGYVFGRSEDKPVRGATSDTRFIFWQPGSR